MYTTQLILKCDLDINFCDYHTPGNIKLDMIKYDNNIKFITLYLENESKEKMFEKFRDDFILKLKSFNIYVSVLYDSISANRHKYISNSIYDLERNFRNLIELVFLYESCNNITDLPLYKKINVKSKKENRGDVVNALQNPLDDLDFIKLNDFISENINLDSNVAISEQLSSIREDLNYLPNRTDELESSIERIEKNIEDIKERIVNKNQKLSASKIFNHLTNKIRIEWNDLYKLRNLWAHNNCLITSSEFDKYKKLSKSVENKLDTEFTLLLFNNNVKIIEEENMELTIKKYDINGRENCKLEFIIKEENKSLIIEKDLFTYRDFNKLFEFLECPSLIELNKNPIILFNEKSKELDIVKEKIKNISIEQIEQIKEKLDDMKINTIEGNAIDMAKEISKYLECIFGN